VPALCLAGCGESQGAKEENVSGTAGNNWDCKAGYSNWQLGWSPLKIDWCCKNKQVACHSTSPPFDCKAGVTHWQKGWSKKKKTWCCTYFVVGCAEDAHKNPDKDTEESEDTKAKTSTSTTPPNAGDFVTDECWSKHQALPSDAQDDPTPKNCNKFDAKFCSWLQAGSREKMCFPKVCVAKHLAKEIADKGHSKVEHFHCDEEPADKAHEKKLAKHLRKKEEEEEEEEEDE